MLKKTVKIESLIYTIRYCREGFAKKHLRRYSYQYGAFWAMNERKGIDVLKCMYSNTCAREDIPHPVYNV